LTIPKTPAFGTGCCSSAHENRLTDKKSIPRPVRLQLSCRFPYWFFALPLPPQVSPPFAALPDVAACPATRLSLVYWGQARDLGFDPNACSIDAICLATSRCDLAERVPRQSGPMRYPDESIRSEPTTLAPSRSSSDDTTTSLPPLNPESRARPRRAFRFRISSRFREASRLGFWMELLLEEGTRG
jgi:hypothetical protein